MYKELYKTSNRSIVDVIGAARSSIADPFLPKKVEEGRPEDIRECIGCNICAAWNNLSAPSRCTQNPTMGEEWRKGWHPATIAAAIYEGHRYAREMDSEIDPDGVPFKLVSYELDLEK